LTSLRISIRSQTKLDIMHSMLVTIISCCVCVQEIDQIRFIERERRASKWKLRFNLAHHIVLQPTNNILLY
jgi:hypothetical protein